MISLTQFFNFETDLCGLYLEERLLGVGAGYRQDSLDLA